MVRIVVALMLFGALSWAIVRVNLPLGMAANGNALPAWRTFPGSAKAASVAARELLIAGKAAAAVVPARSALAVAPVDQRALTTVALAENGPAIVKRMELSAALGWRDRLTQLWLADAALASDQPNLFAQRVVAVARQTGNLSTLTPILDYAVARPAIRTALLPYLRSASRWRAGYLNSDPGSRAAAQSRVLLLDRMRRMGIVVPASDVTQIVRYLVHYDLPNDAYAVWRAHLDQPQFAGVLYDGRFEHIAIEGEVSPFQWTTLANPVGYVVQEGKALHVQQDQPSVKPLLRQSLRLSTGRYRLQWQIAGGPANEASTRGMPFSWEIDCTGRLLTDPDQIPHLLVSGQFAVNVDVAEPCPRADLTLKSRVDIDGSARREAYITQVELVKR